VAIGAPNSPLKKAFRSPFDGLSVSGKPCGTIISPLVLSLSKHERGLFQRAAKQAVTNRTISNKMMAARKVGRALDARSGDINPSR
jgi:hypothetical protein